MYYLLQRGKESQDQMKEFMGASPLIYLDQQMAEFTGQNYLRMTPIAVSLRSIFHRPMLVNYMLVLLIKMAHSEIFINMTVRPSRPYPPAFQASRRIPGGLEE